MTASRPHEFASYTAPATVTTDSDPRPAGNSRPGRHGPASIGREETVNPHCIHDPESFETGAYEGVFEFNGEGGFTDARATRVAARADAWRCSHGPSAANGGGSGEAFGPGLPGARIRGVSYAAAGPPSSRSTRTDAGGKTIFTASLAERRGGIKIFREITGVAPAGAFRYDPKVRTATLGPPAPFAGTASPDPQQGLLCRRSSSGDLDARPSRATP